MWVLHLIINENVWFRAVFTKMSHIKQILISMKTSITLVDVFGSACFKTCALNFAYSCITDCLYVHFSSSLRNVLYRLILNSTICLLMQH